MEKKIYVAAKSAENCKSELEVEFVSFSREKAAEHAVGVYRLFEVPFHGEIGRRDFGMFLMIKSIFGDTACFWRSTGFEIIGAYSLDEGWDVEIDTGEHCRLERLPLTIDNCDFYSFDKDNLDGRMLAIGGSFDARSGGIIRLGDDPASVTKEFGDVYAVLLDRGVSLYAHGKAIVTAPADKFLFVLCDRVFVRKGNICCDGYVRQELAVDDPNDVVRDSEPGNGKIRHLCESRGARVIRVPGEIVPLHRKNVVLVNAFSMSGTSYYEVPLYVWEQIKDVQ